MLLRVTIYDIAKEADVGIGTVSRVFNNHPSVAHETRSRVLEVATRLNYRPHPYARGLARNRTNSILAVIPFFTTFFFLEILQGVQSKLAALDCDLILYGVNHPDQVASSLRQNALRSRVDGILFFSMTMPEEFALQYLQHRTPVIVVDSYHKSFDSLTVDNQEGAFHATMHLIKLGHKRIGLLNANIESAPARERSKGFQNALTGAGLAIDPELVKNSNSPTLDGFTRDAGYELMKQFLSLKGRMPTAIVVASDIQAVGALAAINEAGLKCPNDVALIGFDDIELASHLELTTMRQPMYEMGALAADILADRLKNPKEKVSQTKFVPKLIVRKTCGASMHQNHLQAVAP